MHTPDARTAPDGLPLLRAGSHLAPEDGACLMEYVSVLAGTAFNDHPPCTDPAVAIVARMVNDASTDSGRPQLAVLAPQLAQTGQGADARRTAAVICAALRAAQAAAGDTVVPHGLRRGAQRRYDRVTGTGPRAALARRLDPVHLQGMGRRRLEVAFTALQKLPDPERDSALRSALAAALAAALVPVQPPSVPTTSSQVPSGNRRR